MLKSQQELNFSQYTDLYDKLIPQNHLFRKINELIDFSFIRDDLKDKYCPDDGRTAEDPEYLFKFLSNGFHSAFCFGKQKYSTSSKILFNSLIDSPKSLSLSKSSRWSSVARLARQSIFWRSVFSPDALIKKTDNVTFIHAPIQNKRHIL